jgi:hypothetical protein
MKVADSAEKSRNLQRKGIGGVISMYKMQVMGLPNPVGPLGFVSGSSKDRSLGRQFREKPEEKQ